MCQTDKSSALAKLTAWHSTTGKLFSEGHKWLTRQSLNKYLTVNICILANGHFNVHLYLTKFISWVAAVSMSLLISTMARHKAIMRYSLNHWVRIRCSMSNGIMCHRSVMKCYYRRANTIEIDVTIAKTAWASCQIRNILVAHAPGMPGTFSPPPQVSDPDMHHVTCVTHMPWCMPGSLTSGFLWSPWRGKRS